ncbi:MAG: HAD-IIIC family phosphatase [Burkholderiaceae bacterium]|nr:HAD-IIIC family phosphatase [Burkholderiaceae bacterium]
MAPANPLAARVSPADPRAALLNPTLSMTQLLQALKALEAVGTLARTIKFGISSSVTAELLGTYLRKHAALNGVKLEPVQGNYDDLLRDMQRFAADGVEQAVVIPFLDNLLPSLEASLSGLNPLLVQDRQAQWRSQLQLALKAGAALSAIYISTFHRMSASSDPSGPDAVELLVDSLNAALREEAAAHPNVRLIDAQKLLATIGTRAAFDARFYYRAKAPYSARYFDAFAGAVASASRGFGSYFYKVLALDCDNTLWGGIVGEDGVAGLKLGPHDYPGNIFWRAQQLMAELERHGVLLCLCTKNNAADVEEALASHPAMVLKPAQIVARRVNWADKPQNLRELAAELNVGLDSFIFLDDSDFECAAVRSQLPQVHTVQVPKNLPDYPRVLEEISRLFLGGGVSAESRSKTQQYQQRAAGAAVQAEFATQEDYLHSLKLQALLSLNARASTARISELSKKSNQFNLTTRRYSEAEIAARMDSESTAVYSLVVRDRFGDAGPTGVVVMRYEGRSAHVEAFFMSCRVIGRGVEYSIWNRICEQAAARGCGELLAEYIPSPRNMLVERFFDDLGMQPLDGGAHAPAGAGAVAAGVVKYRLALPATGLTNRNWIEFIYA